MLTEHGNGGTVGPGTGISAPTGLTTTPGGQVDPRVVNKCPTFSGLDIEWSEWFFLFESVATMANFEPAMEGAFTELAE